MDLSRKDFLLRSGAALLPAALTGAALRSPAAETSSAGGRESAFNVRAFEAKGDALAKDTVAIQSAMDAAGSAGGTVYFPPGRYLSGTVRFRSHVSVFLDAGATWIFSPDQQDFDPHEKLDFESFSDNETTDFHYALLRGQDVEHVSIFGPGTIDGNRTKRGGPKPIAFKNCRHVAVRDVTIQNAPNYNLSLLGCNHVNIDGVTILNGYADGIDPDCCHDVRIANCYVEAFDDAIVPKASFALGRRRSTENVTVTNCVLTSACNCFKLGTESSGDFKNITVSNCSMFARPDLWQDRFPTSGISLEMVDGARLERVAISNIVMADMESPIFVRLGNRGRAQAAPKPEYLEGVVISDMVATGARRASIIAGIPGFPVRGVTLQNIRVSALGGGSTELLRKEVPELESEYPDADMFGDLPAYGLFCRHVEKLALDKLGFQLEKPDARPAMILDRVDDFEIRALRAAPPASEASVVALQNVRRGFIQGMRAEAGTKTLFKLSGPESAQVHALANDFSAAQQPFAVSPEAAVTALRQAGNLLRTS